MSCTADRHRCLAARLHPSRAHGQHRCAVGSDAQREAEVKREGEGGVQAKLEARREARRGAADEATAELAQWGGEQGRRAGAP